MADSVKDLYDEALKKQENALNNAYISGSADYGGLKSAGDNAYRQLSDQAKIDKAMQDASTAQSDRAAGITTKAAPLTVSQRSQSNLRNTLGKTERQQENYDRNVDSALGKLQTQTNADKLIYSEQSDSQRLAASVSQSNTDKSLALQQRKLDQQKDEALYERALYMFTDRMINNKGFEAITGEKVKPLPEVKTYSLIFKDAGLTASMSQNGTANTTGDTQGNTTQPVSGSTQTTATPTEATGTTASTGSKEQSAINYFKNNEKELKRKYGKEQYNIAVSYYLYKCVDQSYGSNSETMKILDDYINNSDNQKLSMKQFYKGLGTYFNTAIGEIDAEEAKYNTAVTTINLSGNTFSYSGMVSALVDSYVKLLPQTDIDSFDGNYDPLKENVAAALSGKGSDPVADKLIDLMPKVFVDMLKYKTSNDSLSTDNLRGGNDLTPDDMFKTFETEADMPSWYKMPENWTPESFGDAMNVFVQNEYWKRMLGDNYDTIFTDHMPTTEELTKMGHEEAEKDSNYKGVISDDAALNYGILNIRDELLDKNGPENVKNIDTIGYSWDPVDGIKINIPDITTFYQKDNRSTIISAANKTIDDILWKKYSGQGVTNDEYMLLNAFGMTEITDYLKSLDKVEYGDLTKNVKDLMKNDIITEGYYESFNFTDEELNTLKTASVDELDQMIVGESGKANPDKQWLSALKLYRYYKNDLGIEITGDYEADRTAAKKVLVQKLKDLTGEDSFEQILVTNASMNNTSGYPSEDIKVPEEWIEVNNILQVAPAELFMNTADETEATYGSGEAAFIGGLRKGFTLGLAELVGENVADPEEYKRMALLGNQVGGTEYYRDGRFYNPGIAQEDARLADENQWAYLIGDVAGSLPVTIASGGLAADTTFALTGSEFAAKFAAGFVPMAIQGGAESAAEGGGTFDIALNSIADGLIGGISMGIVPPAVEDSVRSLLKDAPGLIKTVVPKIASAGAFALTNEGLNTGKDILTGKKVDWGQTLANLPTDFVFALAMSGWKAEDGSETPADEIKLPDPDIPVDVPTTVIDPLSGDNIDLKPGDTLVRVNPDAAEFYKAALDTLNKEGVENPANTGETADELAPENITNVKAQNGTEALSDDDLFLDYANTIKPDEMPSLDDFAKMKEEGGVAWNELTLKKNFNDAVKDNQVSRFATFNEYKAASDYVRNNAPELAENYGGDIEAAVNDVTNKVHETGKTPGEVVEGINGNIDSQTNVVDNIGKNIFTGKLKGEDIKIEGVQVKKIKYVKRNREELQTLRNEFESNTKKRFLQKISNNHELMKKAGFTEDEILLMQKGWVPFGWQVHHKMPLDDGGNNIFDNLVLIKNDSYHKIITNYQNSSTSRLKIGESIIIDWPIPDGQIYPIVLK